MFLFYIAAILPACYLCLVDFDVGGRKIRLESGPLAYVWIFQCRCILSYIDSRNRDFPLQPRWLVEPFALFLLWLATARPQVIAGIAAVA